MEVFLGSSDPSSLFDSRMEGACGWEYGGRQDAIDTQCKECGLEICVHSKQLTSLLLLWQRYC